MNKITITFLIIPVVFLFIYIGLRQFTLKSQVVSLTSNPEMTDNQEINEGDLEVDDNPLSIELLRHNFALWKNGSLITIEQTLPPGNNYDRFITSYLSEGLKIYALLTVPKGVKPAGGWPVIVFNHGYIPPLQYRTSKRYVAYIDGFARSGYIVFKPDYRGHGNSEGDASGAYGSNAYTIDVLNAVSSVKKYKDADPNNIGMWGHSLGGFISLRNMVIRQDIKAGVIWAGVVASYPDLLTRWRVGSSSPSPRAGGPTGTRRWRQLMTEKYGTPEQNPDFWNSISANYYLSDISGPLQLHHGTGDNSVPLEFSEKLTLQLKNAGKEVELFTYPGDDHNLSNYFNTAMQRSVTFFNKYLKGLS